MAAAGEEPVHDECTEAIISGISSKVTEDYLMNFVEYAEPDCLVEEVVFKREGTALVTFETPVDMKKLQMTCETVPLEGQKVEVRPVDKRGAVLICNPCPQTTDNCFKYYLSNKKRSGGGNVVDIQRDGSNRFLIAYFQHKEDAEQVAKRPHILENQKLRLELFDPNFDEFPDSDEEHFSEPPVDSESVTGAQPDNDLPQPMETAESDYGPAISDRQVANSRSEEVSQEAQAAVVPVNKPELFVAKVGEFCELYQKVLDVFFASIVSQLCDVQITIEDDCVEIQGERHEVEKTEALFVHLRGRQRSSMYIQSPAASFCGWDDVFDNIRERADSMEYGVALQEGPFGAEEFCIRLYGSDQPMSFDEFLHHHVSCKSVPVKQKEHKELLTTVAWEVFTDSDMEKKFGDRVMFLFNEKDRIDVIGNVDFLEEAAKLVELFLVNAHDAYQFSLSAIEAEFVQKFLLKGQIHQREPGAEFAELSLDGCCVKIEGNRAGVRMEVRNLKQFQKNFKCNRAILSHPKLDSLQRENGDLWMPRVMNIASENRCLVKELPDPQIQDADEDGEVWGQWMATVIYSVTLPGQPLEMHLVEGKAGELKVDAGVLCSEIPLHQPQAQLGHGGRPKTYQPGQEHKDLKQRGGICVVQPGARPCKAVIQVSLQYYLLPNESWDDSVKKLMDDLFRVCEEYHFSSVALPVFGVGVGKGSKPIDKAARTLVNCITEVLCSERRHTERPLQHLFLCSPRAACLHGLAYTLQDKLAFTLLHPSPHSFAFLPTDIPKPRTGPFRRGAIQVIRGDIAKAQTEGLVVPCDIDIDLDLYKSPITKSLTRGGMTVQSSVRGGIGMLYTETIEKRNEDLAEKRILCGKAGELSAFHIFYVYLPPWGPNATQILRECIEKSLQEAAGKKCKSVALAALGGGKLNYPVLYAARTALCAVADFLDRQTYVTSVHIVCYDQVTYSVFRDDLYTMETTQSRSWVKKSMDALEPKHLVYPHHTDPSYAQMASQSMSSPHGHSHGPQHRKGARGYGGHSHHRAHTVHSKPGCAGECRDYTKIKSIKLRIKCGDITHEKCYAVVNSTNAEFDFKGGVSIAMKRTCSDLLITFCQKDRSKKEMKSKGVVVTEAYGLPCQAILHLDMERFRKKPKEALLKCLTTLLSKRPNCTSVAFPALGAGASDHNAAELVVTSMIEALGELKKPKNLQEVDIVLHNSEQYQYLLHHLSWGASGPNSRQPNPCTPAGAPAKAAASAAVSPSQPPSVLVTKVPSSEWDDRNAQSLFIFSEREDDRERVCHKLAEELESLLGKVRPETLPPKGVPSSASTWGQGYDDHQVGCMAFFWGGP